MSDWGRRQAAYSATWRAVTLKFRSSGSADAASTLSGSSPKRSVHGPGTAGWRHSFSIEAMKSGRGQDSAPSRSRGPLDTCASDSGHYQCRKRWARAAKPALELREGAGRERAGQYGKISEVAESFKKQRKTVEKVKH